MPTHPSGGSVALGRPQRRDLSQAVGEDSRVLPKAFCFSDLWEAYQKVMPPDQHQACAKQEGETNHVERFNLTLRQRIGRLTRKSLSFSKSVLMHLIVFRLFLVRYNGHKAKHYLRSTMAR